ncbi:leucine-rich repeat-containing protein 23 [Scleropages formosus]|uniref:Leucine-rich repeat-containing protein 23 n=1 Tax=Scleropages formosus TaxID=113540 RepID=A0A8C9RKC6_SCLFO|nr:leucine-rich repeat-containing protein 23 [Scleropages formosus]XP_018580880.1 leucine-rich repeat-containing protein 23 [Scleropages formosus]
MSEAEDDEFILEESEFEDAEKEEERKAILEQKKNVPCPLTQDMITESLSLLCKTGNGLGHAFVKLDLRNRNLTEIGLLGSFVHLRFLDVSSNRLTDLSSLAPLTQLLWLKVDRNLVQSLKDQPVSQLAYLQWLSLAQNCIQNTEGLGGPALESLTLTGNKIQRVSGLDSSRLTSLVALELRGNQLETTHGIYLPNLRRLYLGRNRIKRLDGLEYLESLTTLHLRDNQLETLDGINSNMKSLQYLNVRNNKVFSPDALSSLAAVSTTLQVLILTGNPVTEGEDYRISVLKLLPQLERLDKQAITEDEKAEVQERLLEIEGDDGAD